MSSLASLKNAVNLSDVAVLLQLKPQTLAYILYKLPPTSRYTSFVIPKKTGGERLIAAPVPELKYAQRKLATLLLDCQSEVKAKQPSKRLLSHGFTKGGSIVTNAKNHRKKRFVFNIDLNNFFGTINFGRVRGFFITNNNFGLSPAVATVIAQIACHENALPQGSPCSPVISNLIGHILDIKLAKLAADNGCNYSRYVDDITFSTNASAFPEDLAISPVTPNGEWDIGKKLHRLIEKSGFSINPLKTRVQYKMSRQQVTGLVVNQKVNIRREYSQIVRSMTHKLIRSGSFRLPVPIENKGKTPCDESAEGTLSQLNGMLSFINWVGKYNLDKDETKIDSDKDKYDFKSLSSNEKVFRNFLLYKNFYSPALPTIVVEGKTDVIYLSTAIRSLAAAFPTLVETKPDGSKKLKVRFFRYNKLTHRLLDLNGGVGQLCSLIGRYENLFVKFRAPIRYPVLIVADNDDGAVPVIKKLRTTMNDPTIDGNAPFYHVNKNLFAVFIKKLNNKNTAMENLFPASVLNEKYQGKTFNMSNDDNSPTEFGKYCFAENIVAKNRDKIDYSGFKDILTRMSMAIESFKP